MDEEMTKRPPLWTSIKRILRCESDDQCLRIQEGQLTLKRLGKWSVLFTVGTSFFISDLIAAVLDRLQGFEMVVTSFAYRWTFGLFEERPRADVSLIAIWKFVDLIQTAFFLVLVFLCIRWAYADTRVSRKTSISFQNLMWVAAVTNLAVYFTLRHYTGI
mgnify:CR=1 FL=1